jgi:hypothetical protein
VQLQRQTKKMENMELLKAMQEMMDANQAKMLAIMEANQDDGTVGSQGRCQPSRNENHASQDGHQWKPFKTSWKPTKAG